MTHRSVYDPAEFERLVKDALSNIHDYVLLETHPLAALTPRAADERRSRAEALRARLLETLEQLRPRLSRPSPASAEWRPYLLLHSRYVEGLDLRDLEQRFPVGERQLRREQMRALQALASLLRDRLCSESPPLASAAVENSQAAQERRSATVEDAGIADRADRAAGDAATPNGTLYVDSFATDLQALDLRNVIEGVAAMLQQRANCEGPRYA